MINEPQCWIRKCKFFIGVKNEGGEKNECVVCKAFPNGIPDEIAYGDNLHLEVYPGDNGIRYEEEI